MRLTRVLTLLASAVLAVAACSSAAPSPAPVGGGASSGGGAGTAVDAATSPTFGMVLTGPTGMTLYTHAGDSATS